MNLFRLLIPLLLAPFITKAAPVKILRSTDKPPGIVGETFAYYSPIGFDSANHFYFTGPGRTPNSRGIWKVVPSPDPTPELIVAAGDSGPGDAVGVTTFSNFATGAGLAFDGTLGVFTTIDSGNQAILAGSGATNTFELALTRVPPIAPAADGGVYGFNYLAVDAKDFMAILVQERISPTFPSAIYSGIPGRLTRDLVVGDASPAGSPFKVIARRDETISTAQDRSYTFTASLENDLIGLFLKKADAPLQTLLLEGSTAPGTDLMIESVGNHSRSPGGYMAVEIITPFQTRSMNRLLVSAGTSFTELSVGHLLPGNNIRARRFSEITAFDTGVFFLYGHSYFVDGELEGNSAIVRTSGLIPQIEIIAQDGQAAPGFPEGFTYVSFTNTSNVGIEASPRSDGTAYFLANVSDGSANVRAFYISRPGSPPFLIGKIGDTYAPDPEATIASIGTGTIDPSFQYAVISPDGSVAYSVQVKRPDLDYFDVYIDYATPPTNSNFQTYAQWSAANGVGNAADDDDFDGLKNALEFVLAGDPNDPMDARFPIVDASSVTLTRNVFVSGADLVIEASTDGITWSSTLLQLETMTPGSENTEVMTYAIPDRYRELLVRVRAIITHL